LLRDHGAHGRFDRCARSSSLQLALNTSRWPLFAGSLAAFALARMPFRR
jgi:hypothetical protein